MIHLWLDLYTSSLQGLTWQSMLEVDQQKRRVLEPHGSMDMRVEPAHVVQCFN